MRLRRRLQTNEKKRDFTNHSISRLFCFAHRMRLTLVLLLCAITIAATSGRVVFPLHDGRYIQLRAGDPPRSLIYELRFDLALPALLSASPRDVESRTLDAHARTEQVQLGAQLVRLPYWTGVLAPARASAHVALSDRIGVEGVVPMGSVSPLWVQSPQYYVDAEHFVLGAYRPKHHHRFELLVTGNLFCGLVRVSTHAPWRAYALRVDLANDYTLLPVELFAAVHNASGGGGRLEMRLQRDPAAHDDRHADVVRVSLDARSRLLRVDALGANSLVHSTVDSCATANVSALPVLTLGRLDTLEHFAFGRDEVRDRSVLLWRLAMHAHSSTLVHYMWLPLVLVPLLLLWYTALYESVLVRGYRTLLGLPSAPTDGSSFITVENDLFARTLLYYTQLVVCVVSVSLLLGLRVEMLPEPEIASPLYVRALCYTVMASAVVRAFVTPTQLRRYGVAASTSISNALLLALWLTASAESSQLSNMCVMLVCSGMVLLRDCEFALQVLYTPLGLERYNRTSASRGLWTLCAALRCAVSFWLFAGYTLPLNIEFWWPTQPFAPALISAVTLAVVAMAMLNVLSGVLTLVRYCLLRVTQQLLPLDPQTGRRREERLLRM